MIKSPILLLATMIAAFALGRLPAAGETPEKLTFHTDWKGERITLPPDFAPTLSFKGIEEIRFAPGMFDPKSESFFSYVLVFSISTDQELTPEVIQRETLVYYRGLASAVSKSRGKAVDASKFTFALETLKESTGAPEKIPVTTKVAPYTGELNWVEPFATAQPQILHFEIHAWTDATTERNYLFFCVSPKARGETDSIWKELRQIRRSFEVVGK